MLTRCDYKKRKEEQREEVWKYLVVQEDNSVCIPCVIGENRGSMLQVGNKLPLSFVECVQRCLMRILWYILLWLWLLAWQHEDIIHKFSGNLSISFYWGGYTWMAFIYGIELITHFHCQRSLYWDAILALPRVWKSPSDVPFLFIAVADGSVNSLSETSEPDS